MSPSRNPTCETPSGPHGRPSACPGGPPVHERVGRQPPLADWQPIVVPEPSWALKVPRTLPELDQPIWMMCFSRVCPAHARGTEDAPLQRGFLRLDPGTSGLAAGCGLGGAGPPEPSRGAGELGKRERRQLRSYLEGLVLHLLKWRYQPDYRRRSWHNSTEENWHQIPEEIQQNRTLGEHLPTLLQVCYPRARRIAAQQTRLPLTTFPATCPWIVDQVLAETFWPGEA